MIIDAKVLNKLLAVRMHQITYHDHAHFLLSTQEWFNIHKTISIIHFVLCKQKPGQNPMMLSTDMKKVFGTAVALGQFKAAEVQDFLDSASPFHIRGLYSSVKT